MLTFGSVCSGIEAASVAWKPLGWKCAFMSEIEAAPRAVLSHHYANTPLHGDFTTIKDGEYEPVDVLVGGTPCQSFSVAGLRGGMADERGNLALEYLRLADRLRPRWLVWENVPGVLSSNGGRDFGSFLGGLGQLGYGFAYRVLDAQFFGLAQRRKRVFVVGHFGDWRRAAAVLFEPASLRWDTPPRRDEGQDAAGTLSARASAGGGLGTDFECAGGVIPIHGDAIGRTGEAAYRKPGVGIGNAGDPMYTLDCSGAHAVSHCLTAKKGYRSDGESETFVAHTLRGHGFDASEDGTGRGTPIVPCFAIQERAVCENPNAGPCGVGVQDGVAYTLEARSVPQAVAFAQNQRDELRMMDVAGALASQPGMKQQTYVNASAVRRLTPRECERLQGFPDDFTLVSYRGKPMADGPRYRALGNSMAVPVMRWIGRRIAAQHAAIASTDRAAPCRAAGASPASSLNCPGGVDALPGAFSGSIGRVASMTRTMEQTSWNAQRHGGRGCTP